MGKSDVTFGDGIRQPFFCLITPNVTSMKAISMKASGSRNFANLLNRVSSESATRAAVAGCAVAFVSAMVQTPAANIVAAVAAVFVLAALWVADVNSKD